MTLAQCTKAELIWLINRICMYALAGHYLDRALNELAQEKEEARFCKADEYRKLALAKKHAFAELLAPYDGMQWGDIPQEVLEKAAKLEREAEIADKKWAKLMNFKC